MEERAGLGVPMEHENSERMGGGWGGSGALGSHHSVVRTVDTKVSSLSVDWQQ